MYELRKHCNQSSMNDSEHCLGRNGFVRSNGPKLMYLSKEFVECSSGFGSIFSESESLPNFFEELALPKDFTDLLLLDPQPKKIISEMEKTKKIMKNNKKLLTKIEATLSFLQSRTTQSLAHDTNFQGAKLLPIATIPTRRMTDEELRVKLESEKSVLLDLLKDWATSRATHKNIIGAIENYKKLVKKYIRRYHRKDNPIEQLHLLLLKAKNAYITEANSSNVTEDFIETRGKYLSKRKNIKKRDKDIWAQLNLYFMGIGENIKTTLNTLTTSLPQPEPCIQFLNMFVINRLSAIAKMLQYCLDNGITVAEFMEDRTYQKIKARLKRIDEVSSGGIEALYCPSLDEIPFLLSLRGENIENIINGLKSSITFQHTSITSPRSEEELKIISDKNKNIVRNVIEKIIEAKDNDMPRTEIKDIICKIRKKHKRGRKNEKKKPKLDDYESDTNTTPKEHSLKTIMQLPSITGKLKSKVLRFYYGHSEEYKKAVS